MEAGRQKKKKWFPVLLPRNSSGYTGKINQHSGRIIFHRAMSEDLQKVGHTHYFLDEFYVITLPPIARK
jgi:hypothetical protein